VNSEYIAGIFDGEGTVGIYTVTNGRKTSSGIKTYYTARLSICLTYRPTIEALHEHYGRGGVYTQKRQAKHHTPNGDYDADMCKQGWKWLIGSRDDVRTVLLDLLPHLMEKKRQAEIVLDFFDGKLSGEEAAALCKEAKAAAFPTGMEIGSEHSFAGEDNPNALLTQAEADDIRRVVLDGKRQIDVCRERGLSKTLVSRIILNKTYVTREGGD
jgi:hypothetical protein